MGQKELILSALVVCVFVLGVYLGDNHHKNICDKMVIDYNDKNYQDLPSGYYHCKKPDYNNIKNDIIVAALENEHLLELLLKYGHTYTFGDEKGTDLYLINILLYKDPLFYGQLLIDYEIININNIILDHCLTLPLSESIEILKALKLNQLEIYQALLEKSLRHHNIDYIQYATDCGAVIKDNQLLSHDLWVREYFKYHHYQIKNQKSNSD